jgi:hypothetical protein
MRERFRTPVLDLFRHLTPQGGKGRYIKFSGDVETAEGEVYLGGGIRAQRPDGSIAIINHFECKHSPSWEEQRQCFLPSSRKVGGLTFLSGFYQEPFWRWPLVEPQEGDLPL